MTNKERKLDYERSANEFWRWVLVGERMLQASNYLYEEYSKDYNLMKSQKCGKVPPGVEMLAPIIFLRAISLENFLKGLCIKDGESVISNKGNLIFKDHSLSSLYKKSFGTLPIGKEKALKKLEDAIYSWGRYPVPRTFCKWRMDTDGISGIQPIYVWSEMDNKTYTEILSETRKALRDQTRGLKLPEWF